MDRTLTTFVLLLSLWPMVARAQQFECPPPSVNISGGGGIECQCPDGSLASIYGCAAQQQQQPLCPVGTQYCGDSNQCCNQGFYCSHYGCTPVGAVECGGHYCDPGQQCSRSGGCQPAGTVDCGPYYCQPGQRCASGHNACLSQTDIDCGSYHCSGGSKCSSAGCIPQTAADCGNRTFCNSGLKCSRDGKSCLAQDAVDCGSHSCSAGMKCGASNQCLARDAVDCGGGKSCPAGNVCLRGGAECITPAALAERVAAEKQQKIEEAAQRKREADEKAAAMKAAKQKEAEDRAAAAKAAAERKAAEQEAAKREAAEKAAAAKAAAAEKKAAEQQAEQKRLADAKAAAQKKSADLLTETLVNSTQAGVAAMKKSLFADLPREVVRQPILSVVDTTLKGALSVAIPATLSKAQQRDAAKELAELWTTSLTPANVAPIAGRFVRGAAIGAALDYVGNKAGDLLAGAVAKHTSNGFAIEFARSSVQVAVADAYAGRAGGVPGVLATNGVMIVQASAGATVDTQKAATSIRAYEVQINNAIALAKSEPDLAIRDRMLRTTQKALASLEQLKASDPVITTLSNMSVEGTAKTLRSWVP